MPASATHHSAGKSRVCGLKRRGTGEAGIHRDAQEIVPGRPRVPEGVRDPQPHAVQIGVRDIDRCLGSADVFVGVVRAGAFCSIVHFGVPQWSDCRVCFAKRRASTRYVCGAKCRGCCARSVGVDSEGVHRPARTSQLVQVRGKILLKVLFSRTVLLAATTSAVGSRRRMMRFASSVNRTICRGVPCQNVVRLASFQIWYASIDGPKRLTTAVTHRRQSDISRGLEAAPLFG